MIKRREYGVDLLRIVSMFMVILLHMTTFGGILGSCEPNTPNYYITLFVQVVCFCAFNCYALISGYLGVNGKELKVRRIVYLWLQVFFYTMLISFVFAFFDLAVADKNFMLNAFLPVTRKQYWYFTAYFALFFFAPFFNKMINSCSNRQLKQLGISIIIVLSIIPIFFKNDIFHEMNGYSFVWLAALYVLGGIIKKLDLVHKIKMPVIVVVYIASVLITMVHKSLENVITSKLFSANLLISYISPTILAISLCILITFAKMKIKNKFSIKLIAFFAPLSFSVYLIHTNPLIWNNWFKGLFKPCADLSPIKLILAFIVCSCAIFFVCAFIDEIRLLIFKLFRVDKNLLFIEKNIRALLDKRYMKKHPEEFEDLNTNKDDEKKIVEKLNDEDERLLKNHALDDPFGIKEDILKTDSDENIDKILKDFYQTEKKYTSKYNNDKNKNIDIDLDK